MCWSFCNEKIHAGIFSETKVTWWNETLFVENPHQQNIITSSRVEARIKYSDGRCSMLTHHRYHCVFVCVCIILICTQHDSYKSSIIFAAYFAIYQERRSSKMQKYSRCYSWNMEINCIDIYAWKSVSFSFFFLFHACDMCLNVSIETKPLMTIE